MVSYTLLHEHGTEYSTHNKNAIHTTVYNAYGSNASISAWQIIPDEPPTLLCYVCFAIMDSVK